MPSAADQDFLWLTEADVVSLINLSGVIAALERALKLEHEGKARNMYKAQTVWAAGSTNVTGAQFTGDGFSGAKVWTNVGGSSEPLTIVHGADDGKVRAIIESIALGTMRTAALAGVATKWLAAPGADDMALVGSGKQSITQVAAVHAVRPLKRLRVWSPRAENRAKFVELARSRFKFEVVDAPTLEACVENAPIVSTVTRAKEPFLSPRHLAPGAHLNAVGAIIPEFAEIDRDVVAAADRIVVDNLEQVRENSRELRSHLGNDDKAWAGVMPLSAVVAEGKGRPTGAKLTLFKFMGVGLGDLAAGIEIYRRALQQGKGRKLPHAVRFPVDLS
jgi:ornithine cyclodeaminase